VNGSDTGAFDALSVAETGQPAHFVRLHEEDLDPGDVVIAVAYSSLNYKDGLAVTGVRGVIRRFPMIPGIDLAGRVVRSDHTGFAVGDEVLVTGWGLGEDHSGGFAELARVPGEWCQRLPAGLGAKEAMALGTAGLTAMLSLLALEHNGSGPEDLGDLPLVVTGASGGVGSLAVLLAARRGYRVIASTGRVAAETTFLTSLGASEVIHRSELATPPSRPLETARFGAALDAVGGSTLAHLISAIRHDGTVTACGHVGGADLATSVLPFILRGVTLAGINSARLPVELRARAWACLANEVSPELLAPLFVLEPLSRVLELAPAILSGAIRGRVVVRVEG
jgi:acrylyl-CoA reductase (NADPH)